jgi:hypothetical protein
MEPDLMNRRITLSSASVLITGGAEQHSFCRRSLGFFRWFDYFPFAHSIGLRISSASTGRWNTSAGDKHARGERASLGAKPSAVRLVKLSSGNVRP